MENVVLGFLWNTWVVLVWTKFKQMFGRLTSEFWEFLKVRKRYWLLPIVIILSILGMVIVFIEGSAVSPFIYALF